METGLLNFVGRLPPAPEDEACVFDFDIELELWAKNIGDPAFARILGPDEAFVALDTFSCPSESSSLSGLMRDGDFDKTACRPLFGKLGVGTKFAAKISSALYLSTFSVADFLSSCVSYGIEIIYLIRIHIFI